MESKKQSAVEWLIKEVNGYTHYANRGEAITISISMDLVDKAKQMEKEQIEDAWHDGKMLGVNGNIIESYDTPEGFYQKNYGQ